MFHRRCVFWGGDLIQNLVKGKINIPLELSKRATQPASGSGFCGPGQKGPEDKRAQKYLPKPGPLRATGFRASPVTLRF